MAVGRYLSVLTSQLVSGSLAPSGPGKRGKATANRNSSRWGVPSAYRGNPAISALIGLSRISMLMETVPFKAVILFACLILTRLLSPSPPTRTMQPSRNRLDNFKAPVRRMPGDWPLAPTLLTGALSWLRGNAVGYDYYL
ncbi:predicted protein [Histoplasma capsulatum var. duboisii H88]|uniref:Predicted protein n=1 Tax=Ajellomyces capsulatus (strain H88) TaxID=544711 RepID=F0U5S0_AJEC8|nr:predicted protein [Histoplasma capsulatum var. duboisii H88]